MTVERRATGQDLLGQVRRQRAGLRTAMSELEVALAGPAAGNEGPWADQVRTALVDLSAAFEEHVAVTEGPDGLYQDLQESAPRLAGAVGRLTAEHRVLAGRIDALLAHLPGREADTEVEPVRDLGTALLDTLMRHRQRGSDLVYQAYATDIGGET